MKRALLVGSCLLALACRGSGKSSAGRAGGNPDATPATTAPSATPVTVAPLRRETLAVRVSGPGETVALQVESIRAPFAGTLVDLRVQDGDRVRAGQVIGHLVSRSSIAALEGARAMARSATTLQEHADAERALELARRSEVGTPLRATRAGVVVSHQAMAGGLVAQDQEIVTIAATGAVVFVARIDQSELSRVRPGEVANVEIPAMRATLPGQVHAVLPTANANAFAASVRIDFTTAAGPRAPGLFGTASIVVAEERDAQVVPSAAVLRDDITGVTQIATVTAAGTAHWIHVKTGTAEDGAVQVVTPALPAGIEVVTSGLVGLPEGTHVEVKR